MTAACCRGLAGIGLVLSLLLPGSAALAQSVPVESPPISESGLTIPSLWLAQQQFGGKLVNGWRPRPRQGRVDLVVRREVWRLMDYLERYNFINRFGTAANDFRYELRVLDTQNNVLGAYACQANGPVAASGQPSRDCQVLLESGGVSSIRGGSRLSF
ncbi:hypothetical protein H6F94_04415 [Leptolyngbya sp. FACHB-261]|nr:hypothetical protein [Leptolyngbya sp. FACHB-261]